MIGEERFAGLVVVNSETGGRQELAARALFVFIGADAAYGLAGWRARSR